MASYDKVRDNRLRRMANRQGLKLERSRRRDLLATDYGLYTLTDQRLGLICAIDLTMDQAEEFLTSPREKNPGLPGSRV
jgi:hypothetical protein